jgi:hypothetical protein
VILETECHFQQLLDEETGRGLGEREARNEAHRRLGGNEELVRRYAARPELRAWSRRWPSLCFTIVPMFMYLAVGFATLMAILSIAKLMGAYLHRLHVAPDITYDIDLAANVVLLWCLPLCVAAAYSLLAVRRRLALHWPVVGIVLISALASLVNVTVSITGGAEPGTVGAGIGISAQSLPQQSVHAALLVALSLTALWTVRRERRRHKLDRNLN